MNTTKSGKKAIKSFSIFSLGIFLNYSGYWVLINLQSSINIEDGVGTASVTATYATAAIFGVIVTPIILRKLGPQACLLFCELTYLCYILANIYPASYILIPAGVLSGMGEATMWPIMGLFVVHYARCYSRGAKKSVESYITQFFGMFYALYQFSGVFGSLMGYAILFGGMTTQNNETNYNESFFSTPSPPIVKDLSICGKNDCQDPNITEENSKRYEPASMMLIYILVGVMGGLVVIAMFIHKFITKPIDTSLEIQDFDEDKKEEIEEEESIFESTLSIVKATLLHLINPKQLLLTPFALYSGLLLTFIFNEATRAFGSCLIGVEQVGLLTALSGSADTISSFLSCKFASMVGRNVPMMLGICLDITHYMICLFWIPTESSLWVVYILFMLFGLADGIWQPLINELHAATFPENRDIALTVWNMYTLVGIAWQTGWSTTLCVYFKIYFQLGMLALSIVCYCICQKFFPQKKLEESTPWHAITRL